MKTEGEGQLRDRLARERTKLAIERTFLAYVRTALAFIVVGIPALWMFESLAIQVLGWASILLGIGMAVFSISRYATVKRVLLESPPLDGDEPDA